MIRLRPLADYGRFVAPFGACFGAFESGHLRGFGLLTLASQAPIFWMPYIAALGLEPHRCAMQSSLLIDGAFRGMGLGTALYRLRMDYLLERGIEHLFSLVHPENIGSLRLHAKYAFAAIGQLEAYGAAGPRVLMYRALDAPNDGLQPEMWPGLHKPVADLQLSSSRATS
ncbi:MAG: GNAT family N-acetyltransferase [Acidobacteriota bacterium]